ncbi:hypothetical protein [Caloranaerobacter sp. DY30410]|uniref:hypothetical protein n=1 Tax=Caloranaerobacter sp. DY30410 TaxID=3238305 RepID=UPI003CFFF2C7
MPSYTPNLKLEKPDDNETADIQVINRNMDKIDSAVANKVDKEEGKGLSTNDYTNEEKEKLATIEPYANKYVHPPTHPATMIVEDSTHRFVTDEEKNAWNAAEQNAKNYTDTQIADLQQKKLDKSSYTATDVLNKLKTVDGHGSGLDADKLDGLHESIFMRKSANSNLDMNGHIITEVGQIQITDANTKIDEGSNNSVRLQTNSGYVDVGPQNTSYAHIYTDRPNFYFNKDILVKGSKVWHAGNDGSGSGLDADKLDGWHRDDIRNWNNILNKPSTFTPSAHTHSLTDVGYRTAQGYTEYTDSVPAYGTLTKTIPLGNTYNKARVVIENSNPISLEPYGIMVFVGTDKTKAHVVGYWERSTDSSKKAGAAWTFKRFNYITDKSFGKYVLGSSSLSIKEIYISGTNLVIVFQNDWDTALNLRCRVDWEVWT